VRKHEPQKILPRSADNLPFPAQNASIADFIRSPSYPESSSPSLPSLRIPPLPGLRVSLRPSHVVSPPHSLRISTWSWLCDSLRPSSASHRNPRSAFRRSLIPRPTATAAYGKSTQEP